VSTIVTVTARVEIPRLPNFLRMTDGQTLPIEAIDDESLRYIGQAWSGALLELARERRKRPAMSASPPAEPR